MKLNLESTKKFGCLLILISIFTSVLSCKKMVLVSTPESSLSQSNVFNDDLTAAGVMTNLYAKMSNSHSSGINSSNFNIGLATGLYSDELRLWTGIAGNTLINYYTNDLVSLPGVTQSGHEFWQASYSNIYICNSVLDGIANSTNLSPSIKKQLEGEARFVRAFFYFYLTNLYGDVPIINSIDPVENNSIGRNSKQEVYNFIISDLKTAQLLLSTDYLTASLVPYTIGTTVDRVRPTKWSATALLARVYLYIQQFENAEKEANVIINNPLFNLEGNLNSVFLRGSREAIWQLQPSYSGGNTAEGQLFNLSALPSGFSDKKPCYLSPQLVSTFEVGDKRATSWTATYTDGTGNYLFPFKYKLGFDGTITSVSQMTEYSTVFRLAELYLIRAEARSSLNNVLGAVGDINIVRSRARSSVTSTIPNPLPDLSTNLTSSQISDAILHERQVELFCEWGHRWLDLKRVGKVDAVMNTVTPTKGGVWANRSALFPLFYDDLLANFKLTQNPGY